MRFQPPGQNLEKVRHQIQMLLNKFPAEQTNYFSCYSGC